MKKIALGVVGLVVLAAAAVFLFRSSDEEKIEKMLRECAAAAEKGDAEGILRHLDPSCTLNGADYPSLGDRVRRELKTTQGTRIEIGVATQTEGEGADSSVHVRVRAAQHVLGEADLKLRLRKFDGDWKIVKVEEVR